VSEPPVDDFLGLHTLDLSRHRTVVLVGQSGSGKSTLLGDLLARHPAYAGATVHRVVERPLPELPPEVAAGEVVLVDELQTWRDLGVVVTALRRGARLLVASHLPVATHWPLRVFGSLLVRRTDRDRAKLERLLARRGIPATEAEVARFARRYGATYTDLEILLESYPSGPFGKRLARFERTHHIELEPAGV
jgi:energy-coupling factor transporter ATP-binding protein EcfA2